MNLITERKDTRLNYDNSYLLRSLIVEILSELSDPIYMDLKNLRAQVTRSAADAAKIIIHNYPGWKIVDMAKTGSRSADLILSNGTSTCQIEVKNYGRSDLLKLEMSLVKKRSSSDENQNSTGEYTSKLSNFFDIKSSSGPTKEDIEKKLKFPNSNEVEIDDLMRKIESALSQEDAVQITNHPVMVVGNKSPRYISVISGNKNDWTRVRHSRDTSKTKRRKIWTTTKTDVESRIANKDNIDIQKLANAVIEDLSGKGDDYLMLMSNDTSGIIWSLGENNPLGINAPFNADSIDPAFRPRFGTHGGEGDRPAVTIRLNPHTGEFLSS